MPDPEFILLGDALWLDFVNTGQGRTPDAPDRLPDIAAYHRWAKAQKLSSDANIIPVGKLLDLRTTLTGLAGVLASGRQAPSSAVEVINEFLAHAAGYFQLIRTQGKWHVQFAPGHSTHATDAIILSAARSLADTSKKVHRCMGDTCSLFFTDDNASDSRRWCSIEACGAKNRVERRRSLQ
jgi:predicted RNA-binding Zn ribbon-like protein